jgi:hypothetical protein
MSNRLKMSEMADPARPEGLMIIIARRYFAHQIDRNIQTFAGFRYCGIYYRFCFEKDIEIYAIIVGFLAGMFVDVQLLQKHGYVSTGLSNLIGVVFRTTTTLTKIPNLLPEQTNPII